MFINFTFEQNMQNGHFSSVVLLFILLIATPLILNKNLIKTSVIFFYIKSIQITIETKGDVKTECH